MYNHVSKFTISLYRNELVKLTKSMKINFAVEFHVILYFIKL
jgi:hypothetical protein